MDVILYMLLKKEGLNENENDNDNNENNNIDNNNRENIHLLIIHVIKKY